MKMILYAYNIGYKWESDELCFKLRLEIYIKDGEMCYIHTK